MNFNEYQEEAAKTAVYSNEFYPFASLMIESAELADLVAKPVLRGDEKEIDRFDIVAEAGDVLWNLAMCLEEHNVSLQSVAEYNIRKLKSRAERGVLMGSGGDR